MPKKRRPSRQLRAALEVQRKANLSTAGQWDSFASHRDALTELLLDGVGRGSNKSLCVLGAGNVNDLDLTRLAAHYSELHLVDLDPEAMLRAQRRHAKAREALRCHDALDVTGSIERLAKWKEFAVTPEELIAHPRLTAEGVAERLGRTFDRVVSACLWTQLHLAVLTNLGAQHPLFPAITQTTSLTHLRVLRALTAPGGKALLATEVTSNGLVDLEHLSSNHDLLELVRALSASGDVIGVAAPQSVLSTAQDDPVLRSDMVWSSPCRAWLWQQGPEQLFLTYALWLIRNDAASTHSS